MERLSPACVGLFFQLRPPKVKIPWGLFCTFNLSREFCGVLRETCSGPVVPAGLGHQTAWA